jgi:hypothetical protein
MSERPRGCEVPVRINTTWDGADAHRTLGRQMYSMGAVLAALPSRASP